MRNKKDMRDMRDMMESGVGEKAERGQGHDPENQRGDEERGPDRTTHVGVLVAVSQVPVHLRVVHHVAREVQHSQVEAVVGALVKDDLTRLGRPFVVAARAAEDAPDRVVRVVLVQVGPEDRAGALELDRLEQLLRVGEGVVVLRVSAVEPTHSTLGRGREPDASTFARRARRPPVSTHTVHVDKLGELGLDKRSILDEPRLAVRLADLCLADVDVELADEFLASRGVIKLSGKVVDLHWELGLDDVAEKVEGDAHAGEVLAHPRSGVDDAPPLAPWRTSLHRAIPHKLRALTIQLAEVVDHLLPIPPDVVLCDLHPLLVLAVVEEVRVARVRVHRAVVAVG